ncbi:11239_t:CDS:2, partial [Acaulospora morrowiae]
ISQKKFPLTIHVSAHNYDDNLENLNDYSNIHLVRDMGIGIINSYSTQEIHDIALITHLVSISTKSPYLHIFDGVKTAHEFSGRLSRPSTSDVVDIFEKVASKVGKVIGRQYHAFEYVGSPKAETLLIVSGRETTLVKEAVKRISQKNSKIGAIVIRVYRPWSEKYLLKLLPKTTKRIAVLEQVSSDDDHLCAGPSLFSDVAASLSGIWTNSSGSYPELVDVKCPAKIFDFHVNLLIKKLETGGVVNFNEILSNNTVDHQPVSTGVTQCIFWDAESQETLLSSQHIAHILAHHTPLY